MTRTSSSDTGEAACSPAASQQETPYIGVADLAEVLRVSPVKPLVLDATVSKSTTADGGSEYVSGLAAFRERGHLPGAIFADILSELSDPTAPYLFTRPSLEQFRSALNRLGVRSNSSIVVYDNRGGAWAARVWFLFRSFGFEKIKVLDGSIDSWQTAGNPVEFGEPQNTEPQRELFEPVELDGFFVDIEEVSALSQRPRPDTVLICGLRSEVFEGIEPVLNRRGHIPGSINLPYPSLVDTDGSLRTAEVADGIAQLGLQTRDRVIAYCGGGINAAGLALALHAVGIVGVEVYDGSLREWSDNPSNPLQIGKQ